VAAAWLGLVSAAVAQDRAGGEAPNPAPPGQDGPQPQFIRVITERDRFVALQVGIRDYRREAGGPTIRLVPVAHVGEASLYQRLQAVLDDADLVLYESVKPAGAGSARGDTDEQRAESTRAAMKFIAAVIEADQREHGRYAESLDQLRAHAAERDSRLAAFVGAAVVDSWGRSLIYEPGEGGYQLISLAADGQRGGDGPAADLRAADLGPIEPLQLNDSGSLQGQLASALGLKFQLEVIDYDRPRWRCSDMSMDELDRALEKHDLAVAPLQDMLEGSSLPAHLIKAMLGMVKILNTLTDGGASDLLKVMLIELLGDERIIDQAMVQFGQGFGDVIIGERNQVVMDDLKRIIENEPQIESIAVFYGAGHMPDLATRLQEQLGYQPSGEPQWVTAIEVNLATSSVPPQQMRQMRMMLRQSLWRQFGAGARN
jgi:hypothetical protein